MPGSARRRTRVLACRAIALVGSAVAGLAGCGLLDEFSGGHASVCQALADKSAQCPDLLGRGVHNGFLDGPGASRAFLSYNVQACVFRLDGTVPGCVAALEAFVGCANAPACEALPGACAPQLASLRAACEIFVGGPGDANAAP